MEHFTFNQIIEIRIQEYYSKNSGFGVATLPVLPKDNQAVYVPVLEIKDQFSPLHKSEKN